MSIGKKERKSSWFFPLSLSPSLLSSSYSYMELIFIIEEIIEEH